MKAVLIVALLVCLAAVLVMLLMPSGSRVTTIERHTESDEENGRDE